MYDYRKASPIRRLMRRTAATRPMAWLYTRIQQGIDRLVYRLTRGRTTLSAWASGLPVVMLTTIGARTGQRRTLPVLGLVDGDTCVVIASNYGRRRHPAWYHNLRAHPRAWVTLAGVTHEVEAHELEGQESERFFQRGVEMYPGFTHYRRWTANRRKIPVIRLAPPLLTPPRILPGPGPLPGESSPSPAAPAREASRSGC